MRGRGLKPPCPSLSWVDDPARQVAPHAGAWIETRSAHPNDASRTAVVAPHAGAWIETGTTCGWPTPGRPESLPMRGRGLKHVDLERISARFDP